MFKCFICGKLIMAQELDILQQIKQKSPFVVLNVVLSTK